MGKNGGLRSSGGTQDFIRGLDSGTFCAWSTRPTLDTPQAQERYHACLALYLPPPLPHRKREREPPVPKTYTRPDTRGELETLLALKKLRKERMTGSAVKRRRLPSALGPLFPLDAPNGPGEEP
jgi:hypothetical protein